MSTSTGKCPVDHKLLAEQQTAQSQENGHAAAPAAAETQQSECQGTRPLDSGKAGLSSSGTPQGGCPIDHSKLTQGKQEQGKCPVDHSALSAIPGGLKPNGQPPKAVCPFGFGSSESGGPSMTSLHCPKCKALFFDAVKSNCGHTFCRDCIIISKECLSCGDQVVDKQPDTKVQDLVNTFIATHSADPKFVADRKAAGKSSDADATKAEFLLETALQSFAGGNLKAALVRLQLCKDQLLKMSNGSRLDPDVATQLGAVCGSQGDCQSRLGNSEEASTSYQESISYLESCPDKTTEVNKALTVTQNKLGDLLYRNGNLDAAREQYRKALNTRRAISASSNAQEKSVAELDVAFSLAKVADIEQVLQPDSGPANCLQEAKQIAAALHQQKGTLDAASKKRLDLLNAFLSK